ncbi:MAG TPA: glycosyltransferase family 8 protein [Clostridiales bacterium]|nr:glycosyltransferase family 8 protein [Clostridiales bacterium]
MNILITLNANYLKPLRVMLKSLFLNNPGDCFTIYVMHSSLNEKELAELKAFIAANGSRIEDVRVPRNCFAEAPVLKRYPKEMYFRLLAHKLLPASLDRILYLDPDILVINPIRQLYNTPLDGYLYAAASHATKSVNEFSRLRLFPYDISTYYNSGVLLMNLKRLHQEADEQEIYRFVNDFRAKLMFPDQDVLNALYAKWILALNEKLYNYDTRYYRLFMLSGNGSSEMDSVINHSVILHFCGRRKPWMKGYSGVFYSLYKHYEKLSNALPSPQTP